MTVERAQNGSALRRLFDGSASFYDQAAAACGYHGMAWLERQVASIDTRVRRVLDLGCATGPAGSILRNRFRDAWILAADLSTAMLNAAAESKTYDGFLALDLEDWPGMFPAGCFDLVTCLGVTEFLSDLRSFLLEISRVLTTDGRLYVTIQEHVPGRTHAPRFMLSDGVRHHAYTIDEAAALLRDAGFQVLSLQSATGYVYRRQHECPYLFAAAISRLV